MFTSAVESSVLTLYMIFRSILLHLVGMESRRRGWPFNAENAPHVVQSIAAFHRRVELENAGNSGTSHIDWLPRRYQLRYRLT
jgi:hypothetical protein